MAKVLQPITACLKKGKVTSDDDITAKKQAFNKDNKDFSSTKSVGTREVVVTRNENEDFGLGIESIVSKPGSKIGDIVEKSPAERCGQLHVGDTIIAINGINIINMHHGDVVNLIKDCGYSITLTINNTHDTVSDVAQPGLLWRMSSQVYNIGSGVVGAGVGSIKWAASTTYTVGSGVVSATQTVVSKVVPSTTPKPKND